MLVYRVPGVEAGVLGAYMESRSTISIILSLRIWQQIAQCEVGRHTGYISSSSHGPEGEGYPIQRDYCHYL